MNLLLDENLSDRILLRISDLYPESTHVKMAGLIHADDTAIWDFAKSGGYVLLSKDWDFHQMSLLRGFPPKVIYLDMGNCPTRDIIDLPRKRSPEIQNFHADKLESLLILERS